MQESEIKRIIFKSTIKEARNRVMLVLFLFIGLFFIGYNYSDRIIYFFSRPFILSEKINSVNMIYTSLTEGFMIHLQVAFLFAFYFSIPIFFLQLYFFCSKGMYKNEKAFTISIFISIVTLFLIGFFVAYCYIIPMAIDFFVSYVNKIENLSILFQPKLLDYMDLVLNIIIAVGITFQIPVVIFLLHTFNLLKREDLIKYRRHIIVGIFIFAAIITPPDVYSQILVASIMIILIEFSFFCCQIYDKIKK